jgi:hypothetical protein
MELEENVRLINVKSHLWSMVRAAGEGVYKDECNVEQVKTGESGIKDGAKHKFSI